MNQILADVRTGSFHSGPLRPGTQHTSTSLTDNQHNTFRWQQPRCVKVSDNLNQRGLSWKVNRAGLRVYHRLKSHRHRTLCTDIHTNRSWAEVVKFCTSEKDSNMPTVTSPFSGGVTQKSACYRASGAWHRKHMTIIRKCIGPLCCRKIEKGLGTSLLKNF